MRTNDGKMEDIKIKMRFSENSKMYKNVQNQNTAFN